jgi:hypothetical protein
MSVSLAFVVVIDGVDGVVLVAVLSCDADWSTAEDEATLLYSAMIQRAVAAELNVIVIVIVPAPEFSLYVRYVSVPPVVSGCLISVVYCPEFTLSEQPVRLSAAAPYLIAAQSMLPAVVAPGNVSDVLVTDPAFALFCCTNDI